MLSDKPSTSSSFLYSLMFKFEFFIESGTFTAFTSLSKFSVLILIFRYPGVEFLSAMTGKPLALAWEKKNQFSL